MSIEAETYQACRDTIETEYGTMECGRHKGHKGPHSDISHPDMIVYRWKND